MNTPELINCPYCQSMIPSDADVCKICNRDIRKILDLNKEIVFLRQQLEELSIKKFNAKQKSSGFNSSFSFFALAYVLILGISEPLFLQARAQIQLLIFSTILTFIFLMLVFLLRLQNNIWLLLLYSSIIFRLLPYSNNSGEWDEYLGFATTIIYQILVSFLLVVSLFLALLYRYRSEDKTHIFSFPDFIKYFQGPLEITENINKILPIALFLLLLIKFFIK